MSPAHQMPGLARYAAISAACCARIVVFNIPIPPALLEIAPRILEGEFAPFMILLAFRAGFAPWHITQLAAYKVLPVAAEPAGVAGVAGVGVVGVVGTVDVVGGAVQVARETGATWVLM